MHQDLRRLPPPVVDGAVVAAVALAGLAGLLAPVLLVGADPARAGGAAVPLVLLQAGPLWWRRRTPLAVLVVAVAALLVGQAIGEENVAWYLGPAAAAYAVAVYAPRRRALAGLAGLAVAAAVDVALVELVGRPGTQPVALTPAGLAVVAAWGAGRYLAVRRAYLDTLIGYSHQLERERDERARQAVAEERRRIARDLHDQVAHQLGVVSLHAAAARCWLGRDEDRTAAALRSAEDAARSALETMPAILHALRADDAPSGLAPQPTLEDLPGLVAGISGDGVSAEVHVLGAPRPLPPAVELTAYRLVQEALTNVVRHAGPAHAVVELRYAGDRLEVEVRDDGRGLAADGSPGARLGLVGMRERVELLDGVLDAGPRDGGGFEVRAMLPAGGAAP